MVKLTFLVLYDDMGTSHNNMKYATGNLSILFQKLRQHRLEFLQSLLPEDFLFKLKQLGFLLCVMCHAVVVLGL